MARRLLGYWVSLIRAVELDDMDSQGLWYGEPTGSQSGSWVGTRPSFCQIGIGEGIV